MEHQLTPPSGREDENLPRLETGHRTLTGCLDSDPNLSGPDLSGPALSGGLGVRLGESDPGRMLGAVLLLVAAAVVVALGLMWWLV